MLAVIIMTTQKTRYKLTKKLPTIDVDIVLLKDIETYLLSNLPKLFDIDESKIREKYYTEIKEANGEHSLGLIEQYDGNLFPDTTTRITVGLRIHNYDTNIDINISITFDRDELFSNIKIYLFDLNPKEKANGILAKLDSLINERKNLNFFFHPPMLLNIILGTIGYLIPTASSFIFKYSTKLGVASILFGLSIAAYFWLFKKWKPYVSFASNRQMRNNSIANYLLLGVLGFILFSTGLLFIRKYLIGQ
jgi:hypothetical protein